MTVERSAVNRTSSVAPTAIAQGIVQKGAGKNLKAQERGRKLFSGHSVPVTLLNSQYVYKNCTDFGCSKFYHVEGRQEWFLGREEMSSSEA